MPKSLSNSVYLSHRNYLRFGEGDLSPEKQRKEHLLGLEGDDTRFFTGNIVAHLSDGIDSG